jgi:hypothetical protein
MEKAAKRHLRMVDDDPAESAACGGCVHMAEVKRLRAALIRLASDAGRVAAGG